LLEDLGPARFGDAAAGWTRTEAASVVDALASLHATWWNDPRLDEWDWLPVFGDAATQLERFVHRRTAFLERYGDVLSADLLDLTMTIGSRNAGPILRLGGSPRTLLPVDTHLENIAFVGVGGAERPVVFDWQGVGKGLGAVDLSSFLLGGSTEQRRAGERGLLERYHAALVAAGVTGYSQETLFSDYSSALFRWWIGTVNGLGSSYAAAWSGRQAELAVQSVQRWNAVAEDHDLSHGLP
jgi:aminoglycoside/choline kinase family phosphotransferase